jgi:hypothetical protein
MIYSSLLILIRKRISIFMMRISMLAYTLLKRKKFRKIWVMLLNDHDFPKAPGGKIFIISMGPSLKKITTRYQQKFPPL